jgi:hypothetical protein
MNNSYHTFLDNLLILPENPMISHQNVPTFPKQKSRGAPQLKRAISRHPDLRYCQGDEMLKNFAAEPHLDKENKARRDENGPVVDPLGAEHRWDFIDFSGIKPLGFDDFSSVFWDD